MRIRRLAVLAGAAAVVACGSGNIPTASLPTPSPQAAASPTVQIPSPSPAPSQASPVPAQPNALQVFFSGLLNGTYPVHLHSACIGTQQYHVAVLQSLVIRQGAGAISVPSGYFGRGLCLIVYTSPSLVRVLATRRI